MKRQCIYLNRFHRHGTGSNISYYCKMTSPVVRLRHQNKDVKTDRWDTPLRRRKCCQFVNKPTPSLHKNSERGNPIWSLMDICACYEETLSRKLSVCRPISETTLLPRPKRVSPIPVSSVSIFNRKNGRKRVTRMRHLLRPTYFRLTLRQIKN